MNVLLLYATHNGSTEKAAKRIAEKLGNCDVKNIAEDAFDLSEYTQVIIGSNIRMGTVDRKIRKLLLTEIGTLLEKELGIFFCCGFSENEETYFNNNVPPQLLSRLRAAAAVGGELDMQRLRGADRLVAKMVRKADHEQGILRTFSLKDDKIDAFVEEFVRNCSS